MTNCVIYKLKVQTTGGIRLIFFVTFLKILALGFKNKIEVKQAKLWALSSLQYKTHQIKYDSIKVFVVKIQTHSTVSTARQTRVFYVQIEWSSTVLKVRAISESVFLLRIKLYNSIQNRRTK